MTETLTIESMAYQGAGVARSSEGKVVFVDGAVVGDVLRPKDTRSHSGYDICKGFDLLESSPRRVSAPCPYAGACGGCPWQVMGYDEQLRWKRQSVVDALERIGRVEGSEELVKECVPSPQQWHYRNKAELSSFMQGGKLALGFQGKASHERVRIDECLLLPEALAALPGGLAGALNYSLREARESLARVAIRSSHATGAAEVALFMLPSGVSRSLLAKALAQNAELASLVRVIIDGDMAARKVKQVEVLSGAGYWREELCGTAYKVSAPSFFQVNSPIAGAMIAGLEGVLDESGLDASAPVIDLYSGVGTFTLPLAQRFEKVSAIENYGSSIRDLRRNLDEAGLKADAIGGDVARELRKLDPAQLAVVDPPRSGLGSEAVEALLAYGAPQLVYVSCNPTTMARDIGHLTANGYQLVSATPFDQFPQSYHVEVMAVLTLTSHRRDATRKTRGCLS